MISQHLKLLLLHLYPESRVLEDHGTKKVFWNQANYPRKEKHFLDFQIFAHLLYAEMFFPALNHTNAHLSRKGTSAPGMFFYRELIKVGRYLYIYPLTN